MNHSQISSETILKKVIDIISEQVGVEKEAVFLHSDLINDLSFDSLGKMELTMTLEDEFKQYGLKISEESADKIRSVGDLVKYIDTALLKK